jgi:SpoVK/Ycf46/Vps4 family AAA+-type ATPase
MAGVKNQVQSIIDTTVDDYQRIEAGKPPKDSTHHMVITGPPGVGKTMVTSEILAPLFYNLGVTDRPSAADPFRASDLVSEYVEGTRKKVRDWWEKNRGGVLFLDEAYVLAPSKSKYGPEAIDEMMQLMDKDRRDGVHTVLVMAGYPHEMKEFLDTVNPGFKSRIPHRINMPAYSAEDQHKILQGMMERQQDVVTPETSRVIGDAVGRLSTHPNNANGRTMSNFHQQMSRARATRRAVNPASSAIDEFLPADVKRAEAEESRSMS